MSSHQLNNSGLNRTPTWSLQPFKDFANASWHRWSVQPLGIKALVGFGSVVVLGIISVIVRKALSSSEATSTSDKKTDGVSSKPAANPTASPGASGTAAGLQSGRKEPDSASKEKGSSGLDSSAANPPASEGSASEKAQPASGTAAVSESGKKESEKAKWIDILPNQVSSVPFRSFTRTCINEQDDPKFPTYAQGVYCFKPQGILRNKKISNDKKIEVSFSYKEGEVLYSESVSCDVEKYAIPLRNLPYERDIVVKFTVDGTEIHSDMFNVDQIRGAYTLTRASQKLHEHEFSNLARPGKFDAPNLQGGVPG